MRKNFLLKCLVLLLLVAGFFISSAGLNVENVSVSAKDNDEIKMKVFVHYPHPDSDQAGNKGKPQTPSCQVTVNDQVTDFGLTGWEIPNRVVVYRINYSSKPGNLNIGQISSAVANSFNVWGKKENLVNFTEGSGTEISRYKFDGVNLVSWGSVPNNAIAVTYAWYYSDGRWVESDTILNNRLKWSWTDYSEDCAGKAGTYDLQNIMTHENGHWLGLDDLYNSSDKDLTMYGYGFTSELKKDTLGLGDILGINWIY